MKEKIAGSILCDMGYYEYVKKEVMKASK